MSTRCDGVARRSFIIGMRLWPPATTRAPLPRSLSAAMAPSTLVARSYSKAAGVCTALLSESGRTPAAGGRRPRLLGHALARLADVVALLVLHRAVAADDRRSGQVLGPVRAALGVEQPRLEAAALDVAQRRARRIAHGDRGLAAEPGQGERASRVDLADPGRYDVPALGEVAQPLRGRARVEAFDKAHRVRDARLLYQQAFEQVDAGVEIAVDVVDYVVDRRGLLEDRAHIPDHRVQTDGDLAQRHDGGDEVVHEGQHDQDDRHQHHDSRAAHRVASAASSRMTSSEPP